MLESIVIKTICLIFEYSLDIVIEHKLYFIVKNIQKIKKQENLPF